jgi:hypothetical protein
MNKITTLEMELSVAHYFSWRTNLIVPNVSWGFGIHECDLLIVTKAGYCYEIEIKVSLSDLKHDLDKKHKHKSKIIKKLYFAIPEYLLSSAEKFIPEHAGILKVVENKNKFSNINYCKQHREAKNNEVEKLTEEQRLQIARLGTMRIWALKQKIIKLANNKL